jgi:hypothetical protein
VLAQRTADAAVSEAEERAAALMAEAEGKAATTVSDADRHAATTRGEADTYALRMREEADTDAATKVSETEAKVAEMIANAERDARDGAEDLRQRLRTEVSALEALREHLRTDAGRLEAHIAIQRQRVLATVEELQRLTSDPDALREAPVPEFKPVDAVPTAEAMGGGTPPAPPAPPPPVHALDEETGDVNAVADEQPADEASENDDADEEPAGTTTGDSSENADEAFSEDEITGEFPAIVIEELEAEERDDTGPPTMAVPATELLLDDDDPYIAELRRAIVDPSPLGPREDFEPEDAMADFYGGELEDSRWKGFRRRR